MHKNSLEILDLFMGAEDSSTVLCILTDFVLKWNSSAPIMSSKIPPIGSIEPIQITTVLSIPDKASNIFFVVSRHARHH